MSRLFFSPSAREDLDGILDYIAKDNPTAAGRFVGKLKEACIRIAEFPSIGVVRDDLAPGVRCFPVGSYLIFYGSGDVGVEIVRVLHGSRDYLGLVD
jgi:toxin ParE1/3/4